MKRIQLTIEPADNGYTITGIVQGANPQDNFQAKLVAMNDKDAEELANKVIKDAFAARAALVAEPPAEAKKP
jgi:hypothetical protein